MGDEKMSKSLGNVKLIHDLLKDWDGEVIRLALLKAHYRSELVWTEDLLKESKAQLDRWYRTLSESWTKGWGAIQIKRPNLISIFNDLATSMVIADIGEGLSSAKNDFEKAKKESLSGMGMDLVIADVGVKAQNTVLLANLLGLLQKDPDDWFKGGASEDEEAEFDAIAKRREQARAQKDWAAADAARDEATAKGIVLEDGPDGTTWRKA